MLTALLRQQVDKSKFLRPLKYLHLEYGRSILAAETDRAWGLTAQTTSTPQ